jgi:hypothetical protein
MTPVDRHLVAVGVWSARLMAWFVRQLPGMAIGYCVDCFVVGLIIGLGGH